MDESSLPARHAAAPTDATDLAFRRYEKKRKVCVMRPMIDVVVP